MSETSRFARLTPEYFPLRLRCLICGFFNGDWDGFLCFYKLYPDGLKLHAVSYSNRERSHQNCCLFSRLNAERYTVIPPARLCFALLTQLYTPALRPPASLPHATLYWFSHRLGHAHKWINNSNNLQRAGQRPAYHLPLRAPFTTLRPPFQASYSIFPLLCLPGFNITSLVNIVSLIQPPLRARGVVPTPHLRQKLSSYCRTRRNASEDNLRIGFGALKGANIPDRIFGKLNRFHFIAHCSSYLIGVLNYFLSLFSLLWSGLTVASRLCVAAFYRRPCHLYLVSLTGSSPRCGPLTGAATRRLRVTTVLPLRLSFLCTFFTTANY